MMLVHSRMSDRAVEEPRHDLLEFGRAHLAVRGRDPCFGNQPDQPVVHFPAGP